ncbi:hypothetical protein Rhe02_10460 [Rhizocola hellebori]|uniref:Uncharacterized protein n=1 Tax=Rhizocola hellebori TaxID=1392758 RepID=A0A8J3VCW7_9ACTN|nr:hypothetical protein Rhe02_10460 [Rhizocola hellebori]
MQRSDGVQTAQDRLRVWTEHKATHVDMDREFVRAPFVDAPDPSTMQVIFDCRPSAVLWKGLMIEVVNQLDSAEGIRRIGFWDLITNLAHPASTVGAV